MLLEPQMPSDDQARHVDVLCFSKPQSDKVTRPADGDMNAGSAPEGDPEDEAGDMHSDSSTEHILDENVEHEYQDPDEMETNSAAQPEVDTDSAVRPVEPPPIANTNNEHTAQPLETVDEDGIAEADEENLEISAFEATTSALGKFVHTSVPYLSLKPMCVFFFLPGVSEPCRRCT